MYNQKNSICLRTRATIMATTAVLIAGLAFSSSAQAKQKGSDDGWSKWQSGAEGFMGRRRQSLRSDYPVEERRHPNVQARLEKLIQQRNRLQSKLDNLGKGKSKKAANLEKRLAKLNKKILKQSADEQKLIATAAGGSNTSSTLWMHTAEEGLYAITISELAENTGKTENQLRNKARKGKLNITTGENSDSELAKQAVSWHYDEGTDTILYPAKAHITFHSDENAFKFKLSGNKAAPMAVVNGPAAASTGSPTPFRDTLIFEEEPDWGYVPWAVASEPDADFWFWDTIKNPYQNRDQLEIDLFAPAPADSGTARIQITLRGTSELYEGEEHHVSARIGEGENAVFLGSVSWDGFNTKVLDVEFDQSLLEPGDNKLTLDNFLTGSPETNNYPNARQRLDKIELDYQRNPVALNNKLWMHNVPFGTQSVSGFTSDDILVVESPDGSAKLREDVHIGPDSNGGWKAVFNTSGNTDFLITERSELDTARITIDHKAKLRKKTNSANYLIIAPRGFEETAEALALYRGSRYSQIKIAWLEDIYYEFSAGRVDPAAIARFMKRAVDKWNLAPSMVVLLGKYTADLKDRMGAGDNFIPTAFTSTPWELAPSDGRLLGFEDNAPFAFGRIPMQEKNQGLAYIEKLRSHETRVPLFTAVLAADNSDSAGDFHANTNDLETRFLNSLGFDSVLTLLHPDDSVRTNLINSDTWETDYISYDGHGSSPQIGSYYENFLSASPPLDNDVTRLDNSIFPIFTALTCSFGNDLAPGYPSLATTLVMNPTGGAIASIAPSSLSLDSDAQILGTALVDNLFAVNSTIGAALNDAKIQTQSELIDFMPRIYSVVGEPDIYAR